MEVLDEEAQVLEMSLTSAFVTLPRQGLLISEAQPTYQQSEATCVSKIAAIYCKRSPFERSTRCCR